jgi:hypothetical protein
MIDNRSFNKNKDTVSFILLRLQASLKIFGQPLPVLVRKSSRAKARSKASRFFQFEKSGM